MRKIILLLILVLVSVSLSAFDFGIKADNFLAYLTSANITVDSVKTAFWMDSPLGENTEFMLDVNYSDTFLFPAIESTGTAKPWYAYLDVQSLYLKGVFPSVEEGVPATQYTLGRFQYDDPSGYIYSSRIDGLMWGFRYDGIGLDLTGGYTGFFWKDDSLDVSKMDSYTQGLDWSNNVLGSPRLITEVKLVIPPIFNQNVEISAVFQEDLTDPDEAVLPSYSSEQIEDKGGLIDTQYYILNVSGAVDAYLSYDTFAVLNTGRSLSYMELDEEYVEFDTLAFLGGLNLYYSLPSFMGSTFGFGLLGATGDPDALLFTENNQVGDFNTFTTVAPGSTGIVFAPEPGNILKTELSWMMQPFSGFGFPLSFDSTMVTLKEATFFRTTTGAISESGLSSDYTGAYLGSELDIMMSVNVYSDLSASAIFGFFLPATGAFTSDALQFLGALSLTLSL